MATSEINYSSGTVVDLESDTVTPETLLEGETAHDATGASITGTMRTVPDSALLGGKAPEYYLTPVNLLDNSDFRNPVNHNGQTSYTTNWQYTIDRWQKTPCDSIDLTDNGITIQNTNGTGNGGLRQPATLKPGVYTVGAKVQGEVHTRTFTLSSDLSVTQGGNTATSINFQPFVRKDDSGFTLIDLQAFKGATVTIEWVALYEGTYTPESLPPYVPKEYAVEALNCGVPVHPRNLLDNSDFTNPVNQRGVVTSGVFTYFIDRWITGSAGCTLSENGVKLVSNCWFHQRIAKETFDIYLSNGFTFCCETADGTVLTLNTVAGSGSEKIKGVNLYVANDYLDSGYYEFRIITDTSTTCTVKWAALYEGAYTAETLPPYVPKENELAACKRRFRRIGKSKTSDALVFNGYVTSSGKEIIVAIDGIEDMSNVDPTNSKPTVSYSGKIVIRGTAGYCTDATASSPMTDAIITAKYTDIGVGALLVKKSDGSAFAGLTNNTVVAVTFTEGSYIDISNDP